MKLNEAIHMIDELKPNGFSFETKMRWLSELDGKVKTEIIDTHKGGEKIRFKGYTDMSLAQHYRLLIPYPYDDVYLKWLEAQIDYANGEIARYNNSITLYNSAMTAFMNYYNRTHLPLKISKLNYFRDSGLDKQIIYEENRRTDFFIDPNDTDNDVYLDDDNINIDLPPYSEDLSID